MPQFNSNKINGVVLAIFLAFIGLGLAWLIGSQGFEMGPLLVVGIIGLPLLIASVFNLDFGLSFVIVLSFFVLGVKRFSEETPVGLLMDVVIAMMAFGLFIKQIRERDWSFAKSSISIMVFIWMSYNLLEVINPTMASLKGWIYTIRSIAGGVLVYFLALYVMKDLKMVTRLIKLILSLAFITALYTLWQEFNPFWPEFHGLNPAEWAWMNADEERFHLLFQGAVRKFSFMAGPAELGVNLAYWAIMAFALMLGPYSTGKKIALFVIGSLISLATIYTGTRTAYLLLPIGFVFLTFLSLNRYTIVLSVVGLVLGMLLITMPPINKEHFRIQSAFSIFNKNDSDKDASFMVRMQNQEQIQPYIRSHPLGGGLGSVGNNGQEYSNIDKDACQSNGQWGTYQAGMHLACFPPDSGFVRVAVEQGWLGLLLFCSLLFSALLVGIKNYFKAQNPQIKNYYLMLISGMVVLIIADYPQEAISPYPTGFIIFIMMAMMVRLIDFDTETEPEATIQGVQK